MTHLLRDHSAGTWIADSDRPWYRLVSLGPEGFAAYARLRFIPDPTHPDQHEGDVEFDDPSLLTGPELDRTNLAVAALLPHTATPERGYVAVWEGWGWTPGEIEDRLWEPASARSYFLFETDLRLPWADRPDPAFVWPADRAWCVAKDIDPHYAGIGGSADAIDDALRVPGLDVVRATLDEDPPSYV